MRRRQQDPHPAPLPPSPRPGRDEDVAAARIDKKGRRRSRRWPIVVAVGVACTLLLLASFSPRLRLRGSNALAATLRGKRVHTNKERRVVAIGDIHGDKDALVRALQLARLVDAQEGNTWIGGEAVAVQIGDLLNKAEPRDEETLAYIVDVEKQAREAGGSIAVTVGDHDMHNAPKLWRETEKLRDEPFPSWMHAVYVADRTLFVHGSLSEAIFDSAGGSLAQMDEVARAWLAGKGDKPPWIGRGDGPIWSRLYSNKESDAHPNCDELAHLLKRLSVDRMIVGHTVRREGISSVCNGQAWRIDVGLSRTESRAGKLGASEALELGGGGREVKVLRTEVQLKSWTR